MAASRSPGLAIATGTAIAISVSAMYAMHKDAKRTEGQASVFKPEDGSRTIGKAGEEHMSSAQVSEVVSQGTKRAKPTTIATDSK